MLKAQRTIDVVMGKTGMERLKLSGKEMKVYTDLTVTTDSVLHLTAAEP